MPISKIPQKMPNTSVFSCVESKRAGSRSLNDLVTCLGDKSFYLLIIKQQS